MVHHIRMVVQVVQVGLTEYLALQIHLGQVVQVGLLPLVQHQQEVVVAGEAVHLVVEVVQVDTQKKLLLQQVLVQPKQ